MLVELQGEDTIDAATFANACVRMKGAATSIDLQTVMFTTHVMNEDGRGPEGSFGEAKIHMCNGREDTEKTINITEDCQKRHTAYHHVSNVCVRSTSNDIYQ